MNRLDKFLRSTAAQPLTTESPLPLWEGAGGRGSRGTTHPVVYGTNSARSGGVSPSPYPLPQGEGGLWEATRLLDLDFGPLNLAQAAERIARRPAKAPFAYVVTPNADHFVRLARNPGLLPVYRGAMLRLLDSRVVAAACRAIGLPAPPVVAGSDLVAALIAALPPAERMTIIGMSPHSVRALAARRGLAAPFHHVPPMGFDADPLPFAEAVRFVREHPARLIFLAVGSPRQELLAAAIAREGRATGTALCIGSALDYLAGTAPRAPPWMRRRGLEWLHRLAHDPRRLAPRYLRDDPAVFALLLRQRFGRAL